MNREFLYYRVFLYSPLFFLNIIKRTFKPTKERLKLKMKLYTEQEIRILIKNKAISLVGDELILDNEYITTNQFVASMKQIIDSAKGNKNKMESDNFLDYTKSGKKNRNKIRKK